LITTHPVAAAEDDNIALVDRSAKAFSSLVEKSANGNFCLKQDSINYYLFIAITYKENV